MVTGDKIHHNIIVLFYRCKFNTFISFNQKK